MRLREATLALCCALCLAGCSDLLSTASRGIRLFPEQDPIAEVSDEPGAGVSRGSHWVIDEYGERRWMENGSFATGLRKIDGLYYLFDQRGNLLTGWQQVEWSWYYFAGLNSVPAGAALKGWAELDGKTYHFDETSCVMDVGWVQIDGAWYHFAETGEREDGWLSINGSKYRMSDGKMLTGWFQEGPDWYYLDPSTGAAATNWFFVSGSWYCFDQDGRMRRNEWVDGYYLLDTGAMAYDWQRIDGKWYYFDGNGTMLHDRWVDNYYLGSDGAMLTNQRTPDGYLVGPDGAWVTTGEGSHLGDPGTERVTVGAGTSSVAESSSLRTVYFAPGGKTYHYDQKCRELYGARAVAETTLAHALAINLEACTVCAH